MCKKMMGRKVKIPKVSGGVKGIKKPSGKIRPIR